MDESTAADLFRRWFVAPVATLKGLPDGNGGFVAFMTGLALYERLIKARLKSRGEKADKQAVIEEMAKDLGLATDEQKIFWGMFRNGLLHQGMPKSGKTKWAFHDSYSGYPEFKIFDDMLFICINPWKFTDRVLAEFLSEPKLIVASDSFPLGTVMPLPPELLV